MDFISWPAKEEITPMCGDGNCGWCVNTGCNDKNCTTNIINEY